MVEAEILGGAWERERAYTIFGAKKRGGARERADRIDEAEILGGAWERERADRMDETEILVGAWEREQADRMVES